MLNDNLSPIKRIMATKDDIDLLYICSEEGNINKVETLICYINYEYIHLVKAYKYALTRAIKLRPNDHIRKIFDMESDIERVRTNRLNMLNKLNIVTDKNLIEQGNDVYKCSKFIYNCIHSKIYEDNNANILYIYTCKINNYDIFKKFVYTFTNYINFDYQHKGKTTLHIACKNENINILKFLLTKNIDINFFDYKYHNTPLHYAVKSMNVEIITLLLLNKANVNMYDKNNMTPLYYVCPGKNGNQYIFELLLKYGGDINIKYNNKTLLYEMVYYNDYLAVTYLLSLDANPYITSQINNTNQPKMSEYYYETPLNLAVRQEFKNYDDNLKNIKIIKILSEKMNITL